MSDRINASMPNSNDQAATFLLAGVQDAQEIIRAVDVKAEILAAFVALIVVLVQWILDDDSLPIVEGCGMLAGILAIVSVWMLGKVLVPRRKHRPEINIGAYSPKEVFYPPVSTDPQLDVTEFARRARETDWVSELTFELFKLSRIREDKETWFRRALRFAEIAFVLATFCFLLEVGYQ